jgi:hypothetical protein
VDFHTYTRQNAAMVVTKKTITVFSLYLGHLSLYTGCVSESGDFATLFFFWLGNTQADATIAILLPTLERFSYNGAVDWSTTCFCCECVFRKTVTVL